MAKETLRHFGLSIKHEGRKVVDEEYLKTVSLIDSPEIETLVRKYWHDIWQYAFFLTRKEHMADDIAQDTFIRAFRSINSFRGQSTVKTWLLKITRNIAYNYKKSAFLKKVSLIGFLQETSSMPSAESEYFTMAFSDELWNSVLKLPQSSREILILSAQYGLQQPELAELLGIPEGTVKSRLHRARKRLIKRMREEEEHAERDPK
jgi:RNA polymerase sigma-70 factor (ECF subfamily)